MSKKEYVSFYQITKEMLLEEGLEYPNYVNLPKNDPIRSEWENKFQNYRKEKMKYFKDILKNKGVNSDIKYKVNGKHQIPIEDKETIKFLIREYTSKYYKKLRDSKNTEVEESEAIVKRVEEFINKNFQGEEAEKQLDLVYAATEYHSKKASKEIYNRVKEMIYKNINNIKLERDKIDMKQVLENNKKLASFKSIEEAVNNFECDFESDNIPKMRNLNDKDAEHLLFFYEQMIASISEKWNKIVDIFSELRAEEMEDFTVEMMESEQNIKNNVRHKEFSVVLKEAIDIMNGESKETYKEKELNEGELKKLGEIIKSLKPNKN
jgi:hypothetical protein